MTSTNYHLLLAMLYQIQHVTDNLIRVSHTKYDSAQFHSVEILNIDKKIVQMLIDAKRYDITFAEIQEMKYDVEEYSLLNGFLHALIKKYNL